MDMVKPEPLIIGGYPHYTLSSYGPVTIEVEVSTVSEGDVENMMQFAAIQRGGTPEQISDDAWVRENFEGVSGADDLREQMRAELRALNDQMVEQQKRSNCGLALAERLEQRIPQEYLQMARSSAEEMFRKTVESSGLTVDAYLMQAGVSAADLDSMLMEQARANAACEAAVGAWADKREIQVSDEELPQLLGIPADQFELVKSQLTASGEFDNARLYARQAKALDLIVGECDCTYKHATPKDDGPKLKLV